MGPWTLWCKGSIVLVTAEIVKDKNPPEFMGQLFHPPHPIPTDTVSASPRHRIGFYSLTDGISKERVAPHEQEDNYPSMVGSFHFKFPQ